jgi:hypothetical protein
MEESKFFVWNPLKGSARIIHNSYESAISEAKRIAGLEPDVEILVLRVVTGVKYQSKPFIYTNYKK